MSICSKLYNRGVLDGFLSRALNVETDDDKRITIIDDSAYVLTLDYTIKMLNIHERYECGVPVIIEGETGVGKTALVEMLSKLWNQSLLLDWRRKRARIIEFFQRRLGEIETEVSGNYQVRDKVLAESYVIALPMYYIHVCIGVPIFGNIYMYT